MSNDITTNPILKSALSSSASSSGGSSPAVKTNEAGASQPRQAAVVEESGKNSPPETDSAEISREELDAAVATLNDSVQQIQRDLLFSVDDSSGRTVVRVVNTETEEVVRQIPSEEVLRISRNIQDQLNDGSGLIFETSA